MTYELFKEKITNELANYFPADTSISIQAIPKINNIKLDALIILEAGALVSPTIYLNQYYSLHQHGQPFASILNKIITEYKSHRSLLQIDPSHFSEYENVNKKISYKLIHYARNKNLLKDIPHIPFLDLAIVFYCLVAKSEVGSASFLINNNHLSIWNITIEELHEKATFNTPFLLAPHYMELENIFQEFITDMDNFALDTKFPSSLPVYVLTNSSKFNGAACILYDDLLRDIAKQTQSDFYIIPSSVHEVILIAVHGDTSRDIFTSIVEEVNQNEVAEDEILSDHVYFYNRVKNEICL